MESFTQMAANFGLATALLLLLLFAFARVATWLAPRVDRFVERSFAAVDAINKFETRVSAVEQKITTLWEFTLRRGAAEALTKGAATMNSPVVVSEEAKKWLSDELVLKLRQYRSDFQTEPTDAELAEWIERNHGKDLLEQVCVGRGVSMGACLLVAVAAARSEGVFAHEPKDV